MSVSASFDLKIVQLKGKDILSSAKIIEMLMDYGWSFLHNGYASYLPIKDSDNFNWTEDLMGIESLLKIVSEKEKQSELIGVLMRWKDTDIEGDLLIRNDNKEEKKNDTIQYSLSVSMAATRKQLFFRDNYVITDVNWYLERLLSAFTRDGVYVEYFAYSEHI